MLKSNMIHGKKYHIFPAKLGCFRLVRLLPRISARYEAPLVTVVIVEEGQGFLQSSSTGEPALEGFTTFYACKASKVYVVFNGNNGRELQIWWAKICFKKNLQLVGVRMLTLEIMPPTTPRTCGEKLKTWSQTVPQRYVPDCPGRLKGLFN